LSTEWQKIEATYEIMGPTNMVDMIWYGEYLWRALLPDEVERIEVCATDASRNSTCVAYRETEEDGATQGGQGS
jgi:hypothetical protein